MKIQFYLNGEPHYVDSEAGASLLSVVRRLGTASVRSGCEVGDCGSCTVLLDGRPVRACITFAAKAQGREVTTVEALGTMDDLHPIQQAFLDTGAVQCGYCTPGMILVAYELLSRIEQPTAEEIRDAMAGNLCRCTGYSKIVDAVQLAARRKAEGLWR